MFLQERGIIRDNRQIQKVGAHNDPRYLDKLEPNWLGIRKQSVMVEGWFSDLKAVSGDVPPGLTLGAVVV